MSVAAAAAVGGQVIEVELIRVAVRRSPTGVS